MTHNTELRTIGKPRSGKKKVIITSAVALALVAGTTGFVLMQQPSATPEGPAPLVVETGEVTRGNLMEEVRVNGKISYSGQQDLGTELTGVVTALPKIGSTIKQGQELFRIDDRPVTLLTGELPQWREFGSGMSNGKDIAQLEQNLSKLGFFEYEPDQKFTVSTAQAIKRWQKSLGIKQSGSIELGQVVFLTGELRVQAHKAKIGDKASAEVITTTDVAKNLEAMIDTSQRELAPVDAVVDVLLPGGMQTTGTVISHGSPTEVDTDSGKALKIPVQIQLADTQLVADLDNVSVSILLTKNRGTDVLLVPTAALLAQNGGGFAVEVTTKDPVSGAPVTTLVPVELGAFANGLVEVTSGDIKPGDTIVVAQ